MNMVDKVENDKYYGNVNTERVDRRRLYYLYRMAFFSFFFLFTYSKHSVDLLN